MSCRSIARHTVLPVRFSKPYPLLLFADCLGCSGPREYFETTAAMPSEPNQHRGAWVQEVQASQRSEQRASPWKAALELEKKAMDDGTYDKLVAHKEHRGPSSPQPPQPPTH